MSERKGTKALELWCKRLVKHCPEVLIENMTTSWRNGIAFCALVHHFRPDLIDMSKLSPENIYENNQLAFSVAEKHLGIPSLLDPEDMVENDVPDRLSVLTYLSQFYQRLGHTVNTKASESDSKGSPSSSPAIATFQFGKTGLDKCAACEQPVYLAQRLIVSHKLYHRRCFRCSKCSGHMNPKTFEFTQGSDFVCDSCKNEKSLTKCLNNNDQMGMLAFDDEGETTTDGSFEESVKPKHRPHSILDKISIFESKEASGIENKISNMSLEDTNNISITDTVNISKIQKDSFQDSTRDDSSFQMKDLVASGNISASVFNANPEKSYKSNAEKFNFLQTQLMGDADVKTELISEKYNPFESDNKNYPFDETDKDLDTETFRTDEKELSNVTDDIRIANTINSTPDMNTKSLISGTDPSKTSTDSDDVILPPRRKKLLTSPEKVKKLDNKDGMQSKKDGIEYPDDLNPFSDDEEQVHKFNLQADSKKETTNPFGSSDEEDDVVAPIQPPPTITVSDYTTPAAAARRRRLIAANPFWSDGEEPTSEDESEEDSPEKPYASALATSTPILPTGTPRRRKAPAPPPPPVLKAPDMAPATSMDDVASLSSLSSHNSTIPDHKSMGGVSPRSKKRLAPTPPPDSVSGGSMERGAGVDSLGNRSHASDGGSSRVKRPAPGLPLPERRSVKLQISPEELQVQLDILETQQLGLERQGVMIEQMIRDKCEGDEAVACTVPQEEVEDLVIQLCELVNEKNDLFRKQTELMYIRRQQRLEQEQADIEHEIRVIQSRPAVNRIDADKAREEQLVSRLVCIVRMRDELVQQIDAERRRERQEDLAIANSIAIKRAQRNSNNSMKSEVAAAAVTTPKKNKVKDKVKKQLKKAKHSLAFKKKEDSEERDAEKGKKVK